MRHWSSLFTLALVVGLAAGVTVDAPVVLALTVAISAAWAAMLLGARRGHAFLSLTSTLVLVGCAAWLLGAHAVDRALHSPLRTLLEQRLGGFALDSAERRVDEPIIIEGRLVADAMPTDDGAVIRVLVSRVWVHEVWEATSGGVSLGVSGELHDGRLAQWRAGRLIRAPALLRRPARYLNAGLSDQERALARRGVSLVGTVKSAALIEIVDRGRWWEELAASLRSRTRHAIDRHVRTRDAQSSAIATAILIGDRAGLTADTEVRLQEAGTYHVIAISGGNIAILAGLLLGAMALLGVHGRTAAFAAICALTAYAVVAAGGPSVLRATLMASVYLAVRLIDQRTAPANAISLTASAILIGNPLQITDVGMWFTFGATVALVWAGGLPISKASKAPKASKEVAKEVAKGAKGARVVDAGWRAVVMVLVGTVCVELALAPVAAFVFQRVTVAGLVLNFAALPAMTVVQIGAMGVVAADVLGLGTMAGWLGRGVHVGAAVLVESTRLLDYAPWLTWRVPSPHAIVLTLYYASLTMAIVMWRRSTLTALPALVLLLWLVAAPDARVRANGDGRLHLSMLDVGQGDCVLVTFPNGRELLVDTGGVARGKFDIGDRVIGPTLRARRLLALDYLGVTHGDADHIGGAASLVRDFTPQEVWWGIPVAHHEPSAEVRAESNRQRASWRTLQRGDRVDIGGVEVRLHHPPPADWERQRVRNNDSLVIELRFGRVSVLLTGDISREIEDELTASLDLLPIVVLKVAHHGSATSSSSTFLNTARPRIAVIGVGRSNPYGHPAPYVIGRLHDAGSDVFRTDLDGQIDLVTDGVGIRVQTFTGREGRYE